MCVSICEYKQYGKHLYVKKDIIKYEGLIRH